MVGRLGEEKYYSKMMKTDKVISWNLVSKNQDLCKMVVLLLYTETLKVVAYKI